MALWLTTRIFWIACCAIVLYALPITDENDLMLYLKKIGYFGKTSNLETPIMDPPKSTGLSETGEQDNGTIAMMNMPLYGVKNSTERSTRKKRTLPDPPICDNSRLDAITRTASGSVFAFQGLFYWELLENGKAEFYPRRIVRDWSGLDGPVDAAFTLPTGDTYIYKDPDLWKFRNKSKNAYFPKTLYLAFGSDVRALSHTLNAAYTSGKNNITYFFKGNKFIKYKIDGGLLQADKELQPISGGPWNMTLDFVDAAIQWNNETTYFFKGQNYYKYDHVQGKFYEEAHSIGKRWFGCGRRH